MLKFKEGIDIVEEIGGIHTVEAARALLKEKMPTEQFNRLATFKNPEVVLKIANSIAMCTPDAIFVNTGSTADVQFIRDIALKKGEEESLPMKGHTIHYDLNEEQGRITDRTFYIANDDEQISSLALRMSRKEALDTVRKIMTGIMRGKTMIIGFYSRGPVGAPVSNPSIEISSSAYVCHSAEILYRNTYKDFEKEVEKLGHFFTNIHSEGLNRPEDLPNARVLMDRAHLTTYAFNCTYAGNTLLMKKGNHRFAVDRSVYAKRGQELAEHMFITLMKSKSGRITGITGAAPSGCGKTTTAMAGDLFVGDDLAQMWIAADGSVRSINPECGIFGIVEDVNREGDPILMKLLREPGTEVIWSNVLIDEKGIPHWTGNGEELPPRGRNHQGRWEKGMKDAKGKEVPISHPNARCTLASKALTNFSQMAEDPAGVATRVVTYSGRDSDTMPPVWVAKNSDEGVVIGACIVSAATATEVGATGVKRAPWANGQFIPGALGDYMDAQFKFFGSSKIAPDKRPIMAGLNYFLTHEARGGTGKKLLGEKRDVKVWLSWLERRAYNEVQGIDSPIGYLPKYDDLKALFKEKINKEYSRELYDKQFSLYIDNIVKRIDLQLEAYGKEKNLPLKIFEVLKSQRQGLVALKEKYGPIVTPAQLEAAAAAK
ncbi:MAG: phosphoenolpyruvate carboxykinase (GTP) [Desulfobacteraceae bacterium]|nr:phosphoenolpyruvate carboxykinase (GTP) [Desulfobacteraceae bacterium]